MSTIQTRTAVDRQSGDGRELLVRLRRIYGRSEIRRDAFGRRSALPSEIARAIGRNGRG